MKKYRYLGLAVLGVFCILVIYFLLASHQRGENPETFQWVHLQSVNRFYFTEYEKDTATVFCLKDWARIEEIIKLCEESTKTGEDAPPNFSRRSRARTGALIEVSKMFHPSMLKY